jgi:tRNA(Ile)-lysidine synthase
MQSTFTTFIEEKKLIGPDDKVLLAVSGGVDSVLMCRLFSESKYPFAIAHCNFGLRGKESDGDEKFVRELAAELNVPFYVRKFETREEATKNHWSIQMAARELRYNWFAELCKEHRFQKIATAHHATDNAETMLMNLLRGTGPEGLRGISIINGNIIRPMMCFTKSQIEAYVNEQGFDYREDSSNLSEKYVRNKIRQRILPVIHEINPSFEKAILHTSEIMGATWNLLMEQVSLFRKTCIEEKRKGHFAVDISKMISYPQYQFLLYYILNEVGVGGELYKDILASQHSESGRMFYTSTHTILRDRDFLMVEPKPQDADGFYYEIEDLGTHEFHNGSLKIEKLKRSEVRMGDTQNIALLDTVSVVFPLILRNRQEGDSFTPLGMTGSKLLSDFFIDQKIPLTQKSKIPILLCEGKIIWVMGHRISHACKIDPKTEWVYRMKWEENKTG